MKISHFLLLTVFTFSLALLGSQMFGATTVTKSPRQEIDGSWTIKTTGVKAAAGVDLTKLSGSFTVDFLAKKKGDTDVTGSVFGSTIVKSSILIAENNGTISFTTAYEADGKSHEIDWQGTLDAKGASISTGHFSSVTLGSGTFTAVKGAKKK